MNTLGAIYGFHRVAQILLVLLLHGWSSWGGDAVEFGPWPGHRGDVGEPHGRLLASFTVANVTTADEFVAAFVDPAVKLIRLTSSVVDVPISAWDPYRPVILTRNLSVEGCTTVTADWPTLQMNRAVAVITMSNGVFLSFRNMLMDGVLSRNPTPDQGFTMMAPTPPGPPAAIYFGPGAFILPACYPAHTQAALVESTPRSSLLPGKQSANPNLVQDGCVNRTDAPPMQRCFASRGLLVDVAMDGVSGNPATFGQKTNFVVWLRDIIALCEKVPSDVCTRTKESYVCYLELLSGPPPGASAPAPQTSGDQRPQQQLQPSLSTSGTGQGFQEVTAAAPGAKVEAAAEGAAGTGIRGGWAPKVAGSNVIIVACTTGVAVFAALLGLAVWARARRRRRQHFGEGTGGCFNRGADGNINGSSDVEEDATCQRGVGEILAPISRSGAHLGRYDKDASAAKLDGAAAAAAAERPFPSLALVISDSEDPKTLCTAARPGSASVALIPEVVVTPNTDPRASLELHLRVVDRTGLQTGGAGSVGNEQNSVYVDANSGASGSGGGNGDGYGSGQDSAVGKGPELSCKGADLRHDSAISGSDNNGDGKGQDGKDGSSMPTVLELLPVVCGKGAFGRVVEGFYQGQRVAVKLLLSEGEECGTLREEVSNKSFAQEVLILSRCQHPNVVRLLAACVDGPRRCLVMELMETSLAGLIYGNNMIMPLQKVLHIGICIANALAYLHPTITHRDLKPANVLVNNPNSDQPIVKLSDFGIARLRLTVAPTADPEAGTPAYMAPECFDLSNSRISHHADMYSLGVLIWEMLTGSKPWQGLGLMDIAIRVTWNRNRLPVEALPSSRCPQKLKRLLDSCWEVDPVRRPAAAEAAKMLTLILQQVERDN
ncbi:hypothetical protein Vretimale_7405 [Volvox reticuliferus]|uniref:Uncharacterized protein n=1 Tax=Volvox reticuliferus TaxID=1737510 RepID=A0A8J4FNG9_9CHLO|nr:hypothetical protein Vretifemale_7495 [Volvox reticuliferus]GIM02564.1 hypothetical protein Vretimale_7405 [Volvox reticuliferus]